MLDRLVAFKTISSDTNLALIDFVRDYLHGHGIEVNLIYNREKTKANLFAQVGPNVDGGVILSGHTDVVPTEGQDWNSDPFKLAEHNNRLYARGSCDMKGFNATVLAAVPKMIQSRLKKPIQIALSYDEEVGCIGAPSMIKAIGKKLPKASSVIVGEPTMMKVVNAHKTSVGLATHVRGFEVHSSIMHTGVSAIMTASKLINWIAQKTEENSRKEPKEVDKKFNPPFTTLHVGLINGGTAGNITAKDCKFSLDIRCLPSENGQNWIKKYRRFSEKIRGEIRMTCPSADIFIEPNHWVPGLKPETNGTAEALVRQLTRKNELEMVSYGTEAGQFQEAGYSTIICGPGSIEQAHQPNEFLDTAQLEESVSFVDNLVKELS
jgi:acetylornithine deacetylase